MEENKTEKLIRKHEGVEYIAYDDSMGLRTIGVGFNLTKEGAKTRINALGLDYDDVYSGQFTLTDTHVSALFKVDLQDAIESAETLVKNFGTLPDAIQAVIVDMIFNLGAAGFAKFKNTIAAFERKDYLDAANEMQNSQWARQVPNRAKEDIQLVLGCV